MKNWLGIIIFLSIVIVNVILENQKKARLAREEDELDSKPPPPRKSGYQNKTILMPPTAENPAKPDSNEEKDSLQELMQAFFQRDTENQPEIIEPRQKMAQQPIAKPIAQPIAKPITKLVTKKALPAPAIVNQKLSAFVIPRERQDLRQAVIMAEVLGKPKAWQ